MSDLIGKRVRTTLYETLVYEVGNGTSRPSFVPDGTEGEVFRVDDEGFVWAKLEHEGVTYHLQLAEDEYVVVGPTTPAPSWTFGQCECVTIHKADGTKVRCKRVALYPSKVCAIHAARTLATLRPG